MTVKQKETEDQDRKIKEHLMIEQLKEMEQFVVSFKRDCYTIFRKWQSPVSTYLLGDTPNLEILATGWKIHLLHNAWQGTDNVAFFFF